MTFWNYSTLSPVPYFSNIFWKKKENHLSHIPLSSMFLVKQPSAFLYWKFSDKIKEKKVKSSKGWRNNVSHHSEWQLILVITCKISYGRSASFFNFLSVKHYFGKMWSCQWKTILKSCSYKSAWGLSSMYLNKWIFI
jgi:hypothetical protein